MQYALFVAMGTAVGACLIAGRIAGRSSTRNVAALGSGAQTVADMGAKLQVDRLHAIGLEALRNNEFEQAARALALAAARGHARAQLHYGVLCEHGIGVPADIERARSLYREAGAQGDVDAHFRLQVVDLLRAREATTGL